MMLWYTESAIIVSSFPVLIFLISRIWDSPLDYILLTDKRPSMLDETSRLLRVSTFKEEI